MALQSYPPRYATGLVITLCGPKARTIRIDRWAMWALCGALPLLASWYLAATVYFVFHDQVLASLVSRQTEIQYNYEDKIADLKTDLDRETSRGLIDRRSLDTTLRDLSDRGRQLAARTAMIDTLVKQGLRVSDTEHRGKEAAVADGSPADLNSLNGSQANPPANDLRLDHGGDAVDIEGLGKRSELSADPKAAEVAQLFDRLDRAQVAIVERLRDPMVQVVSRQRTALAETGLPLARWSAEGGAPDDVGGPFVPLPAGFAGIGFDQSLAILRDAIKQQARLDTIIDRVPLRHPLEGQLQVTSPFGARLDPFFGRPAMHTGIDLREEAGDAVAATASGVVTIAGSEGGYGNMVEIDHGNGLATRYAHLSSIEVVPHQKVPAGFIVGRVGSTGRATGPHLHYETRINGQPVDPTRFLRAGAGLFAAN